MPNGRSTRKLDEHTRTLLAALNGIRIDDRPCRKPKDRWTYEAIGLHASSIFELKAAAMNRAVIASGIRGDELLTEQADALEHLIKAENIATLAKLKYHEAIWTSSLVKSTLAIRDWAAKDFKSQLLKTLGTRGTHPKSVFFSSRTGQWLKPILRKLLRNGADVTVAIAHPPSAPQHEDVNEYAWALSVRQFVWSLPNALDLDGASPEASLTLMSYPLMRNPVFRPVAIFDQDLIVREAPAEPPPDNCPAHFRGHPLSAAWPKGISEKYTVDAFLRFHPDFDHHLNLTAQFFNNNTSDSGLHPILTWNKQEGFSIADHTLFGLTTPEV